MINKILLAVIVVIILAVLFFAFKLWKGKKFLLSQFQRCNCIVFGKKGTGKDLLFNLAINGRKKPCYANIPYNEKYCEVKQIKDFSVSPNTYENFLNDDIKIIDKTLEENKDFYISDGGIVLPSQYQGQLVKNYPSLPIFYALSRHLTNSNVHINTQNLIRVWDKLREQADAYFKTTKSIKVGGLIFTRFVYYDEYESAQANLLPYKRRIFAKAESVANLEEFEAVHGRVEQFIICQRIKNLKYDTRIYHKIIYGVSAPIKKKIKKRVEKDKENS